VVDGVPRGTYGEGLERFRLDHFQIVEGRDADRQVAV
jgi:hypothetical protein